MMCCRVLTVSFHKFGDFFFPGTGDLKDIGEVAPRSDLPFDSHRAAAHDCTTGSMDCILRLLEDTLLRCFAQLVDKQCSCIPLQKHGKYYSVNVPLRDGTDDATFHRLFKPIMQSIMDTFQPGAVVLQCGVRFGFLHPACNTCRTPLTACHGSHEGTCLFCSAASRHCFLALFMLLLQRVQPSHLLWLVRLQGRTLWRTTGWGASTCRLQATPRLCAS